MQKIKIFIALLLLSVSLITSAQYAETVTGYIANYRELAIHEMQRTGVPAAIKLAQGIYETAAGTSDLVLRSNNHFGIKCKSNWTGESVSHDDDARGECFRKYPSPEDSYKDHSDFLKFNQRYAALFKLDPTDYEGWAYGLKTAGYATNPKYSLALIKLIEDYNLQDYTLIAMGKIISKEIIGDMANTTGIKKTGNANTVSQVSVPVATVTEKNIYPEGEFRLNETKVFFAKKGTSFLAIANEFNVDLSKIFEFNELPKSEEVNEDQLIYLQRKRKTGKDDYCTVLPGESLHYIAQKQAIRLESLLELNWLKGDEKPAPGESLSLKKKATAMPRLLVRENYTLIQDNNKRFSN